MTAWNGPQTGRELGLREALRSMLEMKYGPLPDGVTSRISAAGPDQPHDWLHRVLGADSVGEVFTQ